MSALAMAAPTPLPAAGAMPAGALPAAAGATPGDAARPPAAAGPISAGAEPAPTGTTPERAGAGAAPAGAAPAPTGATPEHAGAGAAPASTAPAPGGAAPGSAGHGFILLVSGPSGAGKGTLLAHLFRERPDCVFSVSATTRPRRGDEVDGREYFFLTREEFERRRDAGWFLEWAEVHGQLYGTPLEQVDARVRAGRVVVLDVDVQGGASVRRVRPDAVTVFVYPPSLDALRQRLLARATDAPAVIERRILDAPWELAQWVHYDYVVMNDRLERAQAELVTIHDAERARAHRIRVS